MDCLFCKIIHQDIPAKVVYRDDFVVAFEDINPKAPHHILLVPIKHIATLNDLHDEDEMVLGHLIHVASKLAKQLGVADDGYRLVFNCNEDGGQEIFHIHLHLLAGRALTWPPG